MALIHGFLLNSKVMIKSCVSILKFEVPAMTSNSVNYYKNFIVFFLIEVKVYIIN